MTRAMKLLLGTACVVVATSILIPWSQAPTKHAPTGAAFIRIDGTHTFNYSITDGATMLDALRKIDTEDSALKLQTKTYAGLGDLVESMYGKANGIDARYWQYLVNGVQAEVGAGAYVLKDGDRIDWTFESYAGE